MFEDLERQAAERARHNENSGQRWQSFAKVQTVGLGSFEIDQYVEFDRTYIDEPIVAYGTHLDVDMLGGLLGSSVEDTPMLPTATGYVSEWDQDERGFYVGCWVAAIVTFPPAIGGDALLLDYGSPGWAYKQVPESDTTDYSSPTLDTSTWSVATAPFGNGSEPTRWDDYTVLWMRHEVPATSSNSMTVTIGVEDHATLYVNGELVVALPEIGKGGAYSNKVVGVPASALLKATGDTHLIALACYDDSDQSGGGNITFADAKVTGGKMVYVDDVDVPVWHHFTFTGNAIKDVPLDLRD